MEKICGIIGIVCLAGYVYLKNLTGYEGQFLGFLAIGVAAFALAYAGILFAYEIPKLITITSLRISKFTLRLVYFTVRKTDKVNTYRLNQINRFKTKYDVTRLLMRKNSRLNLEIEKLRAEVASLNHDIKTVVSTWSPVLKNTFEGPAAAPSRPVLDRKNQGGMTFVEPKANVKTSVTEVITVSTPQDLV